MGLAKDKHQAPKSLTSGLALSEAWPNVVHLKRKPMARTVIADCRMVSVLDIQLFITFDYLFELITRITLSGNSFELNN